MSKSTLPIGRREFFGSSSSLLKNLEIGALAVFLPRVLGRSGCCEQTLTYAVSSLGMRIIPVGQMSVTARNGQRV